MGKVQKRQQLQRRAQIFTLQHQIQKGLQAGALKPLEEEMHHHFAHNLYGREMRIKKGCLVVGKVHRYSCINFIMSGSAEVRSEHGSYRVDAPSVFTSPAGTKRAIYALEDLTWVTVHASAETDLIKLEEEFIDDHASFLNEFGLTEAIAKQVTNTPWVEIPGPYEIKESPIHGQGVFAQMKAGDGLEALVNGVKTAVGRFTNHAAYPTCRVVKDGINITFVAINDFDGEVTVDYREVLQ